MMATPTNWNIRDGVLFLPTPDDSAYLYIDLVAGSASLNPDEPAVCWLLVENESHLNDLAWQEAFLTSVGERAVSASPSRPWFSLEQARSFFDALAQGQIAPFIPAILVRHLGRTASESDDTIAMAAERDLFGTLFDAGLPQRGLRGFLEKNPRPFEVPAKLARELEEILGWLDRKIGTNF